MRQIFALVCLTKRLPNEEEEEGLWQAILFSGAEFFDLRTESLKSKSAVKYKDKVVHNICLCLS